MVTVEPWPDDARVFGEALTAVAESRRSPRVLGEPPHTLAWLKATERVLRSEIQLIAAR